MKLEDLMLRREQFPLEVVECERRGKKHLDFRRPQIPPYHPKMKTEGIDYERVPELLPETIRQTLKDFEEIERRVPWVQSLLEDRDRKIQLERGEDGLYFVSVPIAGRFYVDSRTISPAGGDGGIAIFDERSTGTIRIPKSVILPEELLREYEMELTTPFTKFNLFLCPNTWYAHNLTDARAVFYRNLIIALDNDVVRRLHEDLK